MGKELTAKASSKPAIIPNTGIVYPLSWLTTVRDVRSLSELKVIAAVYGYDAIIGAEAEQLTYHDLLQRTGLTDKSVSEGIRRAINRKKIRAVDQDNDTFFVPFGETPVHDHDHGYFKSMVGVITNQTNSHEHDGETPARTMLYQSLLTELGMGQTPKTVRVAQDIALTPKYPLARLQAQYHYVRYELEHGQDGDASKPIRNPAGRYVNRVRRNFTMPSGFDMLAELEREGWSRTDVYQAVQEGAVTIPGIKDSFGYAAWLVAGGV